MRHRHRALRPWLLGILLNSLLFAPLYFTNRATARLLPAPLSWGEDFSDLFASLLWRRNLDPWRLNVELLLLVLLLALLPPLCRRWQRRAATAAAVALYLALFYYYLYESLARDVFGLELNAYNQLSLLRNVAQAFGGDFLGLLPPSPLAVAGSLIAIVAAHGLAIWLAHSLFSSMERVALWDWPRRGALGLGIAGLVVVGVAAAPLTTAGRYTARADHPRATVSSVALKLTRNVAASREAAQLMAHFDAEGLARAYDYAASPKQALAARPNVWLIFIESYGSVLLERADWRRDYTALLAELERELADDGWHAASVASEAPTWGGGSWLSYTSLLGGLHVDSHPRYLSLLHRYQSEPLPGLITFLRGQGYRHVQLSTLAKPLAAASGPNLPIFTAWTNGCALTIWPTAGSSTAGAPRRPISTRSGLRRSGCAPGKRGSRQGGSLLSFSSSRRIRTIRGRRRRWWRIGARSTRQLWPLPHHPCPLSSSKGARTTRQNLSTTPRGARLTGSPSTTSCAC